MDLWESLSLAPDSRVRLCLGQGLLRVSPHNAYHTTGISHQAGPEKCHMTFASSGTHCFPLEQALPLLRSSARCVLTTSLKRSQGQAGLGSVTETHCRVRSTAQPGRRMGREGPEHPEYRCRPLLALAVSFLLTCRPGKQGRTGIESWRIGAGRTGAPGYPSPPWGEQGGLLLLFGQMPPLQIRCFFSDSLGQVPKTAVLWRVYVETPRHPFFTWSLTASS
jgi:hypothetical protein